jgi:Golgi nucleoside diphosphatase
MAPQDEGLFAWFTVNFLLGVFSSGSLSASFAALDLGGGSTQITFTPSTLPVPGLQGRENFMHEVNN